ARLGLRARAVRGVPGAARRELCALLLPLQRGAGAHGEFGEPEFRRARRGLRAARVAHPRHAQPARVLQPGMNIVRDIASLRPAAAALGPLALVPTMGNLHAGHLSLVRLARRHAGAVAVSIFVNRLQFSPSEDFDRYPRTLDADRRLLESEGVELLFAPGESVL